MFFKISLICYVWWYFNSVAIRLENNIPMGANKWKDKLFVTVPRRRNGVPSSLNYIPLKSGERHNVPLIPYPDWETNVLYGEGGQDHIVSVYRVAVDACDRLWMVDTGVIEILGKTRNFMKHQIQRVFFV